jgi:hypothetical protein
MSRGLRTGQGYGCDKRWMEIEEFHRINRIDEYSLTQRGSEELVNSSRNIQDYYGGGGGCQRKVPLESNLSLYSTETILCLS